MSNGYLKSFDINSIVDFAKNNNLKLRIEANGKSYIGTPIESHGIASHKNLEPLVDHMLSRREANLFDFPDEDVPYVSVFLSDVFTPETSSEKINYLILFFEEIVAISLYDR